MSDEMARLPDTSSRMHDSKRAILTGHHARAWAIKRSATTGQHYNAYPCMYGDAGRHWHVGRAPIKGVKVSLNDWDCEIPEGSKWL